PEPQAGHRHRSLRSTSQGSQGSLAAVEPRPVLAEEVTSGGGRTAAVAHNNSSQPRWPTSPYHTRSPTRPPTRRRTPLRIPRRFPGRTRPPTRDRCPPRPPPPTGGPC